MSPLEIDNGLPGGGNTNALKWVLLGIAVLFLIGLIVFNVTQVSGNGNKPGKQCVDKGESCKSTKDCCADLTCNNGVCGTHSSPTPSLPPVAAQSAKSKLALSYLNAVYPVVPNVT